MTILTGHYLFMRLNSPESDFSIRRISSEKYLAKQFFQESEWEKFPSVQNYRKYSFSMKYDWWRIYHDKIMILEQKMNQTAKQTYFSRLNHNFNRKSHNSWQHRRYKHHWITVHEPTLWQFDALCLLMKPFFFCFWFAIEPALDFACAMTIQTILRIHVSSINKIVKIARTPEW